MSKLGMENTVLRTENADLRKECNFRDLLIDELRTQNEVLRAQIELLTTKHTEESFVEWRADN